ncbi:Protein of unknown function [Micromonospora lupini str. Lupac 08]|uniref:Uncharacterized protein n=1 Tax=Micromonospora lupini str. Lupac 08 TaxID=1150864 RepID=I0L6T8_9ACTN|nr:Protein of unknown function [Micromonospora lupini str. Lupac 08]
MAMVIRPAGRTAVRGGPVGGRLALRETVGQESGRLPSPPGRPGRRERPTSTPVPVCRWRKYWDDCGKLSTFTGRVAKALPAVDPLQILLALVTAVPGRSATGSSTTPFAGRANPHR